MDSLYIVMPAYNEEENIEQVIARVFDTSNSGKALTALFF
jgi:glycosyltransferase involved in cell wall biosynthesis